MEFRGNYLLHLEASLQPVKFACIRIYKRSRSIIQIAWSEYIYTLDPRICEEQPLVLDPWPLVAYHFLEEDFTLCPFTGGFNIKIKDSSGKENACNYMDLPMRLESDCIGGEGVMFNFRADNCLPDVSMLVHQRTTCVASWQDKDNHFAVIRRLSKPQLWCIRFPRKDTANKPAYLFDDLACVSSDPENETIHYVRMDLQRSIHKDLCADEYEECANMPCNVYTEQKCQKTCGACSVSNPPAICTYPRRFRGMWYQRNTDDVKYIEISESHLSIENVGRFRCVVFDDSPPRRERTYTVVSLFDNGCRPRYTCIRLKRLGPSVLRYSLSQSFVWPMDVHNQGSKICDASRFEADPDPIADRYRSYHGTGKPIIMHYPSPKWIDCNMTSSFTIRASFANGNSCLGSIYEVCGDSSRLRMDFDSCNDAPQHSEYGCVAEFEGHYWEKVILLQNIADDTDARCIMFNQMYPLEALVLVGEYCDKKSWGFVSSGLRTPLMKLQIRPDVFPCKNLPLVERTTKRTTAPVVKTYGDAQAPVTLIVPAEASRNDGDSVHRNPWDPVNIPNRNSDPNKNIRQVISNPRNSAPITLYSSFRYSCIIAIYISRCLSFT